MRPHDTKDIRFWLSDEPHNQIFANVERISSRTSVRRQMDLYHACLYDDSELTGLGPSAWAATEFEPALLAFNVVRQAVDTLAAKIAKNQPLPMPITSGGTYQQKRRAQKFGKAIAGTFDTTGVWRTSPTIARDCGLFGTGLAHNYRVGRTIYHERVFPWEVVIDPREAMYGKPRTFHIRRWVDRYVLAERFPDFEEEIMSCKDAAGAEFDLGYDDTCDLVMVIEAWHLPSKVLTDKDKDWEDEGVPAHDGCHVICISNTTLLKEPWRRQYFPFSVLRMSDPIVGWFGTGLAKQLTGLQYTINDTASVVQEAHALSGGYILVEDGSSVNTDKLGNGRGMVLEYNGARPDWINPQPVHPDTWRFVLDLIPKAFEMTGVSQLSAQSQKPAGIESAIAMNTFNDFETERFALFAKQYEEYHIDVAWQQFDLMEEIAKEYGDYKIKTITRSRGERTLTELDYGKIRLDRDQFTLSVMPGSNLSKKPAARLQEVQQLINAGWISAEDGKMLLDFPDLERFNNLASASIRMIESAIDKMLEAEGDEIAEAYTYPEPAFDFKLCIAKGLQMYLDAKADGCPDENLQLVLDFIADAKAELSKLEAPPEQPATQGLDGGMPPPAMDPAMMGGQDMMGAGAVAPSADAPLDPASVPLAGPAPLSPNPVAGAMGPPLPGQELPPPPGTSLVA